LNSGATGHAQLYIQPQLLRKFGDSSLGSQAGSAEWLSGRKLSTHAWQVAPAAFKRENAVPCQSEAGISADSADRRCRLKGLNPGAADLKASDQIISVKALANPEINIPPFQYIHISESVLH